MVVGKIISIFDISIEVILNSDVVKIGDKIRVVVTEIKQGKVSVSRKDLLPKPEGFEEVKREKRDRKDKK